MMLASFHHSQTRRTQSQNSRQAGYRALFESLESRRLLSFSAVLTYGAGMSPQDVVTADFNNDGQPDLATANLYDNTVSVLLGNADSTFQAAQASATGPSPISLAAGDFNADGKIDLATANYDGYNDDVSILLGNGDGTFAAPVDLGAGAAVPWSIATGDLNADGKLDLVVASGEYGGYVSVLLGHGDGTFAAAAPYGPYDNYIFSPALADFNGDGKVDVAVTSQPTDLVKVFLGNGDGTLQEPRDFATGSGPDSVAASDFNADGVLDLVTTSYNGFVSMLLGNGDGTFRTAQFFAAGTTPGSATASDVNGDGVLDLVVAELGSSISADGGVSVLLGNGDGSLAQPITTATGEYSTNSVVMADFNGDGRPDAAAANGVSNSVSVLLNDGNWPSPGVPSLSISDATVTEGNTGTVNATFTVTLSSASATDVAVQYTTADITANAGIDYAAASGVVVIPAGQTSKTFAIAVKGDRLPEPTESFAVNLSAPTGATIGDGQGIGTILDDEPRISIGNVSKYEGNKKTTSFTFTVSLSAAYDQAVTVNYATANGTATAGSDYQAKSGSITFAPGETIKTITVLVYGDKQKETNETFFVDLFGASSNAFVGVFRGIGTILDDDNRR